MHAPWWVHTLLGAAAAALAFFLTLLLQLQERPFLLPMVAVLATALRGGMTAGLTCGAVTLALANYYIVPPPNEFNIPTRREAYELCVFALTAAAISVIAAQGRRLRLTLEATLASIGDAVMVTDNQGRVTFLNGVAEQLTGWTLREARGIPAASVFNVIHEDTREPASSPVLRVLRDNVVVGVGDHTLLIARNGTELPITESGAPIRDEHGRTVGAVLVFRDASTQRQVEEALKGQAEERQRLLESERAARSEAERANRLKDEFLATLSHELRTPLNAVLGWSHMLQRRELSEEQHKQGIASIHRNALAQARLVEDVLDISRMVTGRVVLSTERVDLSEVVRLTADSFTPAIAAKRQQLHLDVLPRAELTGDPHRLRQVVWNLLSNAVKFTPQGGEIRLRLARSDKGLAITVSDTGEGIDPGFLPFVFERFRQGDSTATRRHGGLGLGLALVRNLVELHGGTVTATSAGAGRGTTVTAVFPGPAPAPVAAGTSAHADGDLTGCRVLLLDDNEDARALTTVMLERMRAEVRVCAAAREALVAIGEQPFDLILSDLALPDMDGFDFMRHVRQRRIATPALALTALSEPRHREQAYAAGFGGFLAKPVTADQLQSAMRRLRTPH